MAACVADGSALLASLLDEPGGDVVDGWLRRGVVASTLNVQELVSKIVRDGGTRDDAVATIEDLALEAQHDLTASLAVEAGAMTVHTRACGLSHGDRACLALARYLDLPALTADRDWALVAEAVGVRVELVR